MGKNHRHEKDTLDESPRQRRSRLPVIAIVGALALAAWSTGTPFSARTRSIALPVAASAVSEGWLGSADSASTARLVRTPRADGSQELRGRTRFRVAGALSFIVAEEVARLDEHGVLTRADIRLEYGDSAAARRFGLAERVTLDASAGEVSLLRPDGRAEVRQVAADYPWIYLAVRLPGGQFVSTPVAVTVARRAADARNVVRLITDSETDASVMSDQVAVADLDQDWVVLGNDLATFERDATGQPELAKLEVPALGLELKPQLAPRML